MKLIKSFAFAYNGLKICFASETNFRIHILLTIIATILGIIFNISLTEWLVILLCMVLVITMEMMNTALEKLCDITHQEFHSGIKVVKDIAAGAVLISSLFSLIIGCAIFLPKILILFKL